MKLLLALVIALPALAQISETPPSAIVPVVGSTRGLGISNFKTELQMTNSSDTAMAGWLVFRPMLTVRRYEIAPRSTLSFSDFVAEIGASGLGSLDVLSDGLTIPTIVARAYDDQPGGTTGVNVPVVLGSRLLGRGESATLIVPRDLVRYRFNIGVRTVAESTLEWIVRSSTGAERHRQQLTFAANHFEQQPGHLIAGIALAPDDSIEVKIVAGSAIIYGVAVDNQTNDGSIQVLER